MTDILAHLTTSSSPKPQAEKGKEKNQGDTMITINENISLTKNQHQALRIVCDIYKQSFSDYIQEALVQAMRSDIEDGTLSITLLERLDDSPPERKNEKNKTDERDNGIVQNSDPILEELTRLNQSIPNLKLPS
jgi:hypothetical protein